LLLLRFRGQTQGQFTRGKAPVLGLPGIAATASACIIKEEMEIIIQQATMSGGIKEPDPCIIRVQQR
jgi:hypothetical protein